MIIVIPAREGSKGVPFKNRMLFDFTADIIPEHLKSSTYILSDDIEIIQKGRDRGFNITPRPALLSKDSTSTKETMEYFIKYVSLKNKIEDTVVMLYLTYPERTWDEVEKAIEFMNKRKATSLLCKKEININPYLILKEEDEDKGSQLFQHDIYRRQDAEPCFELSHYISIFNTSVINSLNNNMYNNDTVFMPISSNTIDVDTEKDLEALSWRL